MNKRRWKELSDTLLILGSIALLIWAFAVYPGRTDPPRQAVPCTAEPGRYTVTPECVCITSHDLQRAKENQ